MITYNPLSSPTVSPVCSRVRYGAIAPVHYNYIEKKSVRLLILRAERENLLGQIIIGDRMYGEEQSM